MRNAVNNRNAADGSPAWGSFFPTLIEGQWNCTCLDTRKRCISKPACLRLLNWTLDATRILCSTHQITYQATVFQSIEHLNVAASLTPLQVAHVLPESVYTSQGHQPLGVELPGVPEQSKAYGIRIY